MTLSTNMRERRAGIKSQLDALIAGAESRADKNFTAAETSTFDALLRDLREADARTAELDASEAAEARAAQARAAAGESGTWSVGGESATYRPTGNSFFADLINARRGDRNAADRLARNNSERGLETRALGNTGGTGGSGGEFAPPAWLVDEFVNLARPARVTADLFHKEPLPLGVSSINIPRISGGTAVAVQTTQNTTVAATDITTAALSSNVTTIAGKQVVSRQLLDQSGIPFDRVILQDLAADYARQVGAQAILGTGVTGTSLRGRRPAPPRDCSSPNWRSSRGRSRRPGSRPRTPSSCIPVAGHGWPPTWIRRVGRWSPPSPARSIRWPRPGTSGHRARSARSSGWTSSWTRTSRPPRASGPTRTWSS